MGKMDETVRRMAEGDVWKTRTVRVYIGEGTQEELSDTGKLTDEERQQLPGRWEELEAECWRGYAIHERVGYSGLFTLTHELSGHAIAVDRLMEHPDPDMVYLPVHSLTKGDLMILVEHLERYLPGAGILPAREFFLAVNGHPEALSAVYRAKEKGSGLSIDDGWFLAVPEPGKE